MGPELLLEPWRSFLEEIDRAAEAPIVLHCIGGFAVTTYYGASRSTGDIDVFDVAPGSALKWLLGLGGPDADLSKKYKIYLQHASVAALPDGYEERLIEVFAGTFARLRLFVLDPYDLALSKLTRNSDVDVEDVLHLARSQSLDLRVLETRYQDELRPIVHGRPEQHDITLRLWLDAIQEERDSHER
jgi:hypothetical protein